MTFKSVIMAAVWSGNSCDRCRSSPLSPIPALGQVSLQKLQKKNSSHALPESGDKLSTVQGFPSPMGCAKEGPCFPKASLLCTTALVHGGRRQA